jgi:hypothetical protein
MIFGPLIATLSRTCYRPPFWQSSNLSILSITFHPFSVSKPFCERLQLPIKRLIMRAYANYTTRLLARSRNKQICFLHAHRLLLSVENMFEVTTSSDSGLDR